MLEEPYHTCEMCQDSKPVETFGGVRVEVYLPFGVCEGVNRRDEVSRRYERDSGGIRLHYLYAVCRECRQSDTLEDWKLKARRQMLDEYCRNLAERRRRHSHCK